MVDLFMEETDMETVSRKKKWIQPVGTKSGWRAGVEQSLDESILQGGGVPLSFKSLKSTPYGWNSQ